MMKNAMMTQVYSKLNALPTEEILLQQIFSVITISIFSKTNMVRFCLKEIIILIIIPKFKWLWDYSKLIIVILWYSSLHAWSKRGLNLITYLHDNKYFEKLILKSNFKLTSILLQTWMLEAISIAEELKKKIIYFYLLYS